MELSMRLRCVSRDTGDAGSRLATHALQQSLRRVGRPQSDTAANERMGANVSASAVPAFLCSFRGRTVQVGNTSYSRGSDRTHGQGEADIQAPGAACDSWRFRRGDMLTIMAFFDGRDVEAVWREGEGLHHLHEALADLTFVAYTHFPGKHGLHLKARS